MKITEPIYRELAECGLVRSHAPMCDYTSFRTGGPAEMLIQPHGMDSVPGIVRIARENSIPLTVTGGCSNLLVGDRGVPGIVLMLCENDCVRGRLESEGDGTVYADSTVKKGRFIDYTLAKGLEGCEFMAGIPGCLGGGIMMNAGTVDGTTLEILKRVDLIDADGAVRSVDISDDMLAYRDFAVSRDVIVAGGLFSLRQIDDVRPSMNKMLDILAERRGKHPVAYPSAGSVFKNPDGHSSWRLIDEAGLKRMCVGGAMVSDLHTNFIINTGNATSADIRALIEHIQEKVLSQFNIILETEVRMVGNF